MRTSTSQFEVMVDFMERNSDLNKPADGPHGRLINISKWDELASVLNVDATGTPRTVEKWKKVWSDFKNNTKRKAAKIHRAAGGTGGGPVSRLVLSDLEQRVLSIMGTQSATGLPSITEIGVEPVELLPGASATELVPPSGATAPTPSTSYNVEVLIEEAADTPNRPGESGQSTPFPAVVLESETVTSPTAHHTTTSPARSRRGTRRPYEPSSSPRGEPRRRILRRPAQRQRIDTAAEQFLSSDSEWRRLATEFVTEHARLREREFQQQAQWQILFGRCLAILETFLGAPRE